MKNQVRMGRFWGNSSEYMMETEELGVKKAWKIVEFKLKTALVGGFTVDCEVVRWNLDENGSLYEWKSGVFRSKMDEEGLNFD